MPLHHDPSMTLHRRGGENTVYELLFADESDMNNQYVMYMNREGNWIIVHHVRTGGILTVTYAKGEDGYAAAWTNRASQTYGIYSSLF